MIVTSLSEAVTDRTRRHIVPLSGGKDSTALAIWMIENHGDLPLEFLFTDTGAELTETYDYIARFEALFGVTVARLTALDLPEVGARSLGGRRQPFDVMLDEVYSGFLPNPQARWCTRMLKIKPFEQYVGDDPCYSYIGIRADEDRAGYGATKPGPGQGGGRPVAISAKDSVRPVYPLKDAGLGLGDVRALLEDSGLGLPDYYRWRSRSGCYFCFYQQIGEWQALRAEHPDLFERAQAYEAPRPDGRRFTWTRRPLERLPDAAPSPARDPWDEAEDGCAICHL